jgi:multiple sugar transport system permease protein
MLHFCTERISLCLPSDETVTRTIPVEVAGVYPEAALQWRDVTASATITLLPVVVLTLSLQKFIVRGLALGAVKS